MSSTPVSFSCDLSAVASPLEHHWEHTVGSGHATLALRADWQRQMTQCHRDLGFEHVRFHGLLSDDMGTLTCQNKKLIDSFFNADQICDFLLSIGMRPFMELSFMPSTLASGGDTVFHYKGVITPPRDLGEWRALLGRLLGHWRDRYGSAEIEKWLFEIWNEPNLKAFWTGTQTEYFQLYQSSVEAIKKIDPALKVGGPATAQNQWIPEFLSFCRAQDVPIDFISTHQYPTDSFGQPGDPTRKQLAASHRSVLREEIENVRGAIGSLPLYYTEWSSSSNPFDDLHDRSYAAAFIIKSVLEAEPFVNGYSYWTFSDIFEENYFASTPFHGGFGLMNIYGIPKPSYRAYEILHGLGRESFAVEGQHPTLDTWVTRDRTSTKILVTNTALPEHPIRKESVAIRVAGLNNLKTAYLERIDADHCNSRESWEKMGQPSSLKPAEVDELNRISSLRKEHLTVTRDHKDALIEFSIPIHGVACVTLEHA